MSEAGKKGFVIEQLEQVELDCPDPKCPGKFRANLAERPVSLVHTVPLCESWRVLAPADYLRLAGFEVKA